jgi:hypothetical protein
MRERQNYLLRKDQRIGTRFARPFYVGAEAPTHKEYV